MSLKVVDPIDVTEAIFTDSDIPEPDPAQGEVEWVDRRDLDLVYDPYDPTPTGNDFNIRGMLNADNGFVYMHGDFLKDATSYKIAKIDKNTDAVTYITSTRPFANGVASYFYSPNGKIYMHEQPSGSPVMAILDTADDSITTSAISNNAYNTAQSILDGYIYFAGGSTNIGKYDVENDIMNEIQSGNVNDITCSALGFDQKIYFGDFTGNIIRLDPSDDSISTVSTIQGQIRECAYANGDDIYFFTDGSYIHKYNIPSQSISDVGSSVGRCFEASYATDGYIYYYASDSIGARINRLDPRTDKVITFEVLNSYSYVQFATDDFSYVANVNQGVLKLNHAYQPGDEAILRSTHRRYSAAASTIDNPADGIAKTTPTWIDIGPTNKWAMFDKKTTRQTVSASDFSVTLDPVNQINTLAFLNLIGVTSIRIEIRDKNEVLVYDETFDLIDTTPIYDYYTFFFYQQSLLEQLVDDMLPAYYDPEIKVTFSGTDMSVGEMVAGFATQIGTTISDTSSDTYDYSTQEFDEFGEINYVERPIVNLNTYEILSDKAHNPYIQRLVKKLRGKNALWIGNIGGGQKLITYGRYERSPIPFDMVDHVQYSITVRGSI